MLLTIYQKAKAKIIWNHFIRLFLEEYIQIGIACLIKLMVFNYSNFYQVILTGYSISLLVIYIVFPLVTQRILLKTYKLGKIKSDAFNQKWGALVLDLQIREKGSLYYTTIFMTRRLFLIVSIVILVEFNWA